MIISSESEAFSYYSLEGREVGGDAADMEVNNELLALFVKEEIAVFVVVYKEVLGEDDRAAGCMASGECEGSCRKGIARNR